MTATTRLGPVDTLAPAEKLCLLREYLEEAAPQAVSREEIMARFGFSLRTFYRYLNRLERIGVPLVWLVRYEVTVLNK